MMTLVLSYVVHSANVEEAPVIAKVGDVEVMAKARRLVVELVSNDGEHGHTFRLPIVGPDDLAAQIERFAVGSDVEVSLS